MSESNRHPVRRESAAFFAFLEAARLSPTEAARAIGVSPQLVSNWRGVALPGAAVRLRIERWTRGRVPASAWLSEAEEQRLAAVRPLDHRLLALADSMLATGDEGVAS
jgi:hypothetical protein